MWCSGKKPMERETEGIGEKKSAWETNPDKGGVRRGSRVQIL